MKLKIYCEGSHSRGTFEMSFPSFFGWNLAGIDEDSIQHEIETYWVNKTGEFPKKIKINKC